MSYFTPKYKEITKLPGVPFSILIRHDEPNRWICYLQREQCGNRYEYTLIDNYLEKYIIYWEGSGTQELTTHQGRKIDNSIIIEANKIICKKFGTTNLAMPDFVIDVLETLDSNVGFEIIRRIVEKFHITQKANNNY